MHNNFVRKIFIHSNELHIRDALGIIPYNFFSDIYWKKPNLPGRHGLRKATGRTYLCSALAGTITWRVILDKSSKAVEKKKFFNLTNSIRCDKLCNGKYSSIYWLNTGDKKNCWQLTDLTDLCPLHFLRFPKTTRTSTITHTHAAEPFCGSVCSRVCRLW